MFSPEDGWEERAEDTEVRLANMYNREFRGRKGRTMDIAVAAMDTRNVRRWIEVSEHIFLDEVVDERTIFDTGRLPK